MTSWSPSYSCTPPFCLQQRQLDGAMAASAAPAPRSGHSAFGQTKPLTVSLEILLSCPLAGLERTSTGQAFHTRFPHVRSLRQAPRHDKPLIVVPKQQRAPDCHWGGRPGTVRAAGRGGTWATARPAGAGQGSGDFGGDRCGITRRHRIFPTWMAKGRGMTERSGSSPPAVPEVVVRPAAGALPAEALAWGSRKRSRPVVA
jgi:hypothetical protein